MTNKLIRLFIKNADAVEDPAVRGAHGRLAGWCGLASNLFLFLLKGLAGLISGSIAIVADAFNNLSDAGSSLVTLIGFRLAEKPADERHPYGHERIEYISGLIVSFLVTLAGFELLKSAVSEIRSPSEVSFDLLSLIILIASILVKLWQSRFNTAIGRRIRSAALAATAADSIGDVIATTAVLIGSLIGRFTSLHTDGWLALLVSLFILYTGIKLVIESADPLLGTAPDEETVDRLRTRVLSYEGVIGVHDMVLHTYGPSRTFATLHAEVPAERDVLESHDIIDNIERDIFREQGIRLVIHLDPVVTQDERVSEMNRLVGDAARGLSPDLSIHDLRVVFGVTHHNVIFDVAAPRGLAMTDDEIAARLTDAIRALRPEVNPVITVDRDYVSHVMSADQKDAP